MRIYHNQLSATLNKQQSAIWLIFGDEPWQKNDSLSQIKQWGQQNGFDELVRFSADDKFDWSLLQQEYQSLSLFAERRIIEIELSSLKINEAGVKLLADICQLPNPDNLLIFHGAKLDGNSQKRKWFKALEQAGVFLPLYDIEGKHLMQWLNQQAQRLGLNLHQDTKTLFTTLFEGNLATMQQELEKLSILFQHEQVSPEDAEKLLINQAKFNPFQLIDALLIGDLKRCINIISQLKQEGTAIGQLIWFLHKEIMQLHAMQQALKEGQSQQDVFKSYRIWDKRKSLYQSALANISQSSLQHGITRIAQLDTLSKTSSDFDAYLVLTDICVTLYHSETTQGLPLDYEYL